MIIGFEIDGDKYLRNYDGKTGHIEIALEIIKDKYSSIYERNKHLYSDPVDFLIFLIGAVKVGNRYGVRVISYCPLMMTRSTAATVADYKSRHYSEDLVYPPDTDTMRHFHY